MVHVVELGSQHPVSEFRLLQRAKKEPCLIYSAQQCLYTLGIEIIVQRLVEFIGNFLTHTGWQGINLESSSLTDHTQPTPTIINSNPNQINFALNTVEALALYYSGHH